MREEHQMSINRELIESWSLLYMSLGLIWNSQFLVTFGPSTGIDGWFMVP